MPPRTGRTCAHMCGFGSAGLGSVRWQDNRFLTHSYDHRFSGGATRVALTVNGMSGHAEVLALSDLDTFAPTWPELHGDTSLEHVTDGDVVPVVVPSRHRFRIGLHVPKPMTVLFERHPSRHSGSALRLAEVTEGVVVLDDPDLKDLVEGVLGRVEALLGNNK